MKLGVITLFPEMFAALTQYGVTGRAFRENKVSLQCWNPRDFATDKHQTVDDRPYGGGPGMVMQVEPLQAALASARQALPEAKVIYLSPQGKVIQQQLVAEVSATKELILIAGRYEGLDERFVQAYVDEEWSIGDYVLSGGELPAMVLLDAVIRLLPGVLGDEQSAEQDSFSEGLLDCPHYTRPESYQGQQVPEVLLSGNHGAIDQWRLKQALGKTQQQRPDLLAKKMLTKKEKELLNEFLNEQR